MEFRHSCDVIVAGGGVAGVAAALEAARAGLHTVLVEKTVLFGGLATTGLINFYLPLCDGNGRQVIFGISEELLQLSLKYGPGDVPGRWKGSKPGAAPGRYCVRFSPASFILALDEALEAAGVELWLDTLACVPCLDDRRATGVEVENKSGRGVIAAPVVIDATGDADLIARAGSPCVVQGNWLSVWALQLSQEKIEEALNSREDEALLESLSLIKGGNNAGGGHPEGHPKYLGVDGKQVSRFVLEGRKLVRQYYQQAYTSGIDRSDLFPVTLPSMAQFRTTRRICGLEAMVDGENDLYRSTSIGLTGDWRKPGPVWEIPYGTLIPSGVDGMLAAGRCIDSTGDAWEVTRVIPPAALTGQIAGMAAALALGQGKLPHELAAVDIQKVLEKKSIPYHIDQL